MLNVAVTSHPVKALANLMRHGETSDHVLRLKAIAHRLTKKLHVLNQVAVSHLAVVGSMLKNVPLSQNLIVNLDA